MEPHDRPLEPLSGNDMPRFAGPATFMRLPERGSAERLDIGVLGLALDLGTSNRPGARFGPRAIRAESALLRPYNMATGVSPFATHRIADLGDVALNPYSLEASVGIIERAVADVLAAGCKPLSLGGDHTVLLPILRAVAAVHGPVGLIHVDAHSDVNDTMFGERIAHGTPVRRAVEENLIDPKRVAQIGLRGTGYAADDFDWGRGLGFRVVTAPECWHRSLSPLMDELRAALGEGPVYVSFDVDALDPSITPGTGTPEIGGLTAAQGLEVIRGCTGLNLVGADVVEVSPPYDPSGTTALVGANLAYELLCVLAS